MKIIIKPSEIVERCLWDDYEYYILDKSVDIEEHLEKDEEFEIDEKDALVIGLLKCVETPNLCHRLNQYIHHFIDIKSFEYKNPKKKNPKYYMKKKHLIRFIEKFADKFPEEWQPRKPYGSMLKKVKEYMQELLSDIETLEVTEITDQFGKHDIVEVNHLKKKLKYHK